MTVRVLLLGIGLLSIDGGRPDDRALRHEAAANANGVVVLRIDFVQFDDVCLIPAPASRCLRLQLQGDNGRCGGSWSGLLRAGRRHISGENGSTSQHIHVGCCRGCHVDLEAHRMCRKCVLQSLAK